MRRRSIAASRSRTTGPPATGPASGRHRAAAAPVRPRRRGVLVGYGTAALLLLVSVVAGVRPLVEGGRTDSGSGVDRAVVGPDDVSRPVAAAAGVGGTAHEPVGPGRADGAAERPGAGSPGVPDRPEPTLPPPAEADRPGPESLGSLPLPAPGGDPVSGSLSTVTVTPRAGEPFGAGEVGLWLPRDVPAVRGAFLSTRMAERTPRWRGPDIEGWQTARAARVDFGILLARLTYRDGEPRPDDYRCDLSWPALQRGLDELARKTGHPEIRTMPVLFEESSAGGRCADGLTRVIPDRIVALDLVAAELPERCDAGAVADIPTFVREGSLTGAPAARDLARCRRAGMPTAIALQHDRSGRQLARTSWVDKVFVDAVLLQRVPAEVGAPLLPVDLRAGLLADNTTGALVPYSPSAAMFDRSWLPTSCVAQSWRAFRAEPSGRPATVRYSPCP